MNSEGQGASSTATDSSPSVDESLNAREALERAVDVAPSRALQLEVLGVVAFTCLSPFLYLRTLGPAPFTAGLIWLRLPFDVGVPLVLCALLGRKYRSVWSLPASHEAWWEELGSGVAVFVLCWLLNLAAGFGLWALDVGPRPSVGDPSGIHDGLLSSRTAWAFFLTLPITCTYEEILFRVYLQTRLTILFRGGVLRAILASSVLFMTVHSYGFRDSLAIGMGGAFLGLIFQRSGRLPRLVIGHVLYDVVQSIW